MHACLCVYACMNENMYAEYIHAVSCIYVYMCLYVHVDVPVCIHVCMVGERGDGEGGGGRRVTRVSYIYLY
jgi:hypothetical protein